MPFTISQKRILLALARKSIDTYLATRKICDIDENDPALREEKGAFVTLHKKEELRGCIGNIISQKPLCITVRDMAIASATQDFRFPSISKDELDGINIEISVLSKPIAIKSVDEIQMSTHGVIIEGGPMQQGVFLPQVATETGWSKEEFLSHLCAQKASLPADAWKDPNTAIKIFSAEVFSEKEVK